MSNLELYPESKSWRLWLEELDTKAWNTKRQYLRVFKEFLDWKNITPEELFELRLEHVNSGDPRDERVIEGWVKTYMKNMRDRGLSGSSARMAYKAVNSFFDTMNLEFGLKPREKPKVYHNGQRVITKEQIRRLHDRVGEEHRWRNRAVLLTLKDSGLRVSDLAMLNLGDYTRARDHVNGNGERFKVFNPISTVKTGAPAFVHLGPESVDAVDKYLEELGKEGVELKPEDPLFVNRHGERHTANAMSALVWKLADKLDDSEKISAHSLRKFFQTQMEAAGTAKNWIGKYQGKLVGDSTGVYSQPEELGYLIDAYVKAYENLRIFGASAQQVKEQANRIRELEEKNEKLQAELSQQKSLTAEVLEMREEIFERLRKLEKRDKT